MVVALALAGCRQNDPQVPAACLGDRAVPQALAAAPGPVRLAGGKTKLSDCLVASNETADLETFSAAVLDEATNLRIAARERPAGPALVELGYLRGALHRGADGGLHDELLRRFDDELLGVDTRAAAFRRGEAAGRSGG
jgi:hypothetical protein